MMSFISWTSLLLRISQWKREEEKGSRANNFENCKVKWDGRIDGTDGWKNSTFVRYLSGFHCSSAGVSLLCFFRNKQRHSTSLFFPLPAILKPRMLYNRWSAVFMMLVLKNWNMLECLVGLSLIINRKRHMYVKYLAIRNC